jgi:hypothetical protein
MHPRSSPGEFAVDTPILILFVVDSAAGLMAEDRDIAG